MPLDPTERPPEGGPTYKTRDLIEVIANFVIAGMLIGWAFIRDSLAPGGAHLPLPVAAAILGVLIFFNGIRKLIEYRRRWFT